MTDTVRMLEDPAVEQQIEDIIRHLTARLAIAGVPGRWQGYGAKSLAYALAGRDVPGGLHAPGAVRIILNGLMDLHAKADPAMWSSPLGRALAFWGTGEVDAVTRACAAAALGCSRQNVALMLRSGRLSEPVDAGTDDLVSTASLAHAMRVQAAREV